VNAVLLYVPLVVLALVVLFGFAGCWLPTQGTGAPEPQGPGPWPPGSPPGDYSGFITESGPVAFWPLTDADDAPFAMDKVGPNNHPGTYVGSVTHGPNSLDDSLPSAPGNLPTKFDGTGYIEVAHDPGDSTFAIPDKFSVEALVLPDDMSALLPTAKASGLPDAYIVSNLSARGGWALQVLLNLEGHGGDGWIVAQVRDNNGVTTSVQLPYNLAAPLGSAWWVLMRYQKGIPEGTLFLRVNSQFISQFAAYDPNTTTAPLQIGVGLHGELQDIAVYNRVLGAQEALDHMQASKTP
jgi:hypothetical protein